MAASGSPTVRRRRLAAELRRLRGRRTGTEVSRGIGWSPTKISRAESGRESIPPEEVEKLLDYYGVDQPLRGHLLGLAEDATARGWWEEYDNVLAPEYAEFIGLEAEATAISTYQADVVPGVLQTSGYAEQISIGYQSVVPTTPPGVIDQLVRVRMIRQQRLTNDPPLHLSAVIDEAVLLRSIGGASVMRQQLEHLAQVADLPNVDMRILPLKRDTSIAAGSFSIFSFGSRDSPEAVRIADIVSTESLKSELYIEGEADTYLYQVVFEALARASLSPEASKDLIRRTAELAWR
jgi:hypothetical protein